MQEHWEVLAEDIMSVPVLSVPPQTQVEVLARLMEEHSIGALPVTDAVLAPVGIVTRSDLLRRGAAPAVASGATAADVMTRAPRTIDPNTPVHSIAEMFASLGLGHAPVVSNGKLVGMVSRTDLTEQAIAAANRKRNPRSDAELRASVLEALRKIEPSLESLPEFSVDSGVVHFWGDAPPSDEELEAILRAVHVVRS